MFQPFSEGNDTHFDDNTLIIPGRFQAHERNIEQPRVRPLRRYDSLFDIQRDGTDTERPKLHTVEGRSEDVFGQPVEPEGSLLNELNEQSWLLRPSYRSVETWMSTWWKRWFVLIVLPVLVVWFWCAVPFPATQHHKKKEPLLTRPSDFFFFLFFYYGVYVAVALLFITKIFDIYRLLWWPVRLGGRVSFALSWSFSIVLGYFMHLSQLDEMRWRPRPPWPPSTPGGDGDGDGNDDDSPPLEWHRKTTWVVLAFLSMLLPAVCCFIKLRADRRNRNTRSVVASAPGTYLSDFWEHQISFIPRSYKRFLWFLGTLVISLVALLMGQAFTSTYLSTLPHSNREGILFVWSWIITVHILNVTSGVILGRKIQNHALWVVFRFYFFLVYHVFYRNLFARIRSPQQALSFQILSGLWVVLWYPFAMTRILHRCTCRFLGNQQGYEEFATNMALSLFLRNVSENITILAFLGWTCILHLGRNTALYPIFDFQQRDANDPYTFQLTMATSAFTWVAELAAAFLARATIARVYGVDVTALGIARFREHPDLVIACLWAAIHVLMDMLLYLIRL